MSLGSVGSPSAGVTAHVHSTVSVPLSLATATTWYSLSLTRTPTHCDGGGAASGPLVYGGLPSVDVPTAESVLPLARDTVVPGPASGLQATTTTSTDTAANRCALSPAARHRGASSPVPASMVGGIPQAYDDRFTPPGCPDGRRSGRPTKAEEIGLGIALDADLVVLVPTQDEVPVARAVPEECNVPRPRVVRVEPAEHGDRSLAWLVQ